MWKEIEFENYKSWEGGNGEILISQMHFFGQYHCTFEVAKGCLCVSFISFYKLFHLWSALYNIPGCPHINWSQRKTYCNSAHWVFSANKTQGTWEIGKCWRNVPWQKHLLPPYQSRGRGHSQPCHGCNRASTAAPSKVWQEQAFLLLLAGSKYQSRSHSLMRYSYSPMISDYFSGGRDLIQHCLTAQSNRLRRRKRRSRREEKI